MSRRLLDREVDLEDIADVDEMASLYGIIVGLEHLEKAFVKDTIAAADYEPVCEKLLAQFKTMTAYLSVSVTSSRTFFDGLGVDCPAADYRIRAGVPATVEHSGTAPGQDRSRQVAEVTQNFITLMDAIKLKMRTKDQLHPLLGDLMGKYARYPGTYEGKAKLTQWLITLNHMRASEALSEDQARELYSQVEQAHSEFFHSLL